MHIQIKENYTNTVCTLAEAQEYFEQQNKKKRKYIQFWILYRIVAPLGCIVVGGAAAIVFNDGTIVVIMILCLFYFCGCKIEK